MIFKANKTWTDKKSLDISFIHYLENTFISFCNQTHITKTLHT
jgi:hypothetical protein